MSKNARSKKARIGDMPRHAHQAYRALLRLDPKQRSRFRILRVSGFLQEFFRRTEPKAEARKIAGAAFQWLKNHGLLRSIGAAKRTGVPSSHYVFEVVRRKNRPSKKTYRPYRDGIVRKPKAARRRPATNHVDARDAVSTGGLRPPRRTRPAVPTARTPRRATPKHTVVVAKTTAAKTLRDLIAQLDLPATAIPSRIIVIEYRTRK